VRVAESQEGREQTAPVTRAPVAEARRYAYDEENRLVAVTKIDGSPRLEMTYDALGRRVETADYTAERGDPCGTAASPVVTRTGTHSFDK
jgi:YD repeat-containing protein